MQTIIHDTNHAKIAWVRSLQKREQRKKSELFFCEGTRFVAQGIQAHAEIEMLIAAPKILDSPVAQRLFQQHKDRGTPCLEVDPHVFYSLSLAENPQGIAAVMRQKWERIEDVRPGNGLCWLACDSVHSPGNLGSIIRTCDAVGAAGLILIGNSTDPYDPATVRATMGALFSIKLVRASFAEFCVWKRRHECLLVGTSPTAKTDYRTARYESPMVLFMGSEQKGLFPDQQRLCDLMVRIPMVGKSDSLNLAVATGVMLFEIFNQSQTPITVP